MVKPIVTIVSFVLGGLSLAFAAYVQAHPAALRSSNPSPGDALQQLSGRVAAADDEEEPDSKKAKNEVFVVMIEPMFFMGVMSPEAMNDAPMVTPSRALAAPPGQANQWILSAQRLRSPNASCIEQ